MIKFTIEKYNLKNLITFLCEISNVSRSGYYNYINSEKNRRDKESKDLESYYWIKKAFEFKKRSKGARQIKMVLENEFNVVYNLKKIRRIMRKFNLVCKIRKSNPYKKIAKATKEHSSVENTLKRNFKQDIPRKVLLTDISYLSYGSSNRAYLSVIKDGSTNEILSYEVSSSISLDIATNTIKKLCRKHFSLHKDCFIHSDQGFHYTSPTFQSLLKSKQIGQSMSRKGNCWDNAPIESFFGHLKDEVDFKICKNLSEVKEEIGKYMNYYNNHRYQWNLKKMTPVKYRNHLLSLIA